MDVFVKDNKNNKVLPVTETSNVFDKGNISVEEHLKLIYSELNKRDIKRVYLELEDITKVENPSTFDIVSAMADNTIAMLSVDSESHLLAEIGARFAGVLILVKKTSVYYSCGMFFTYRYGQTFTGVSGLAGKSFEWSKATKTTHSLHSGTATNITTLNQYVKITNWGGTAINPRLDINPDGTITIPGNVSMIEVSAYVVFENVNEEGVKYLQIFKNDVETNIMVKGCFKTSGTLTITPLLLPVVEGDRIDLRVHSGSDDRLRFKHLTIEVIE